MSTTSKIEREDIKTRTPITTKTYPNFIRQIFGRFEEEEKESKPFHMHNTKMYVTHENVNRREQCPGERRKFLIAILPRQSRTRSLFVLMQTTFLRARKRYF